MKVHRAYQFRLYPTDEQAIQMNRTIGCTRYVYNHFLAPRQEVYQAEERGLSYEDCSALLTQLKREEDTAWLREVDKFALQNALQDLQRGFVNFFKGRAKYPRLKKKHA